MSKKASDLFEGNRIPAFVRAPPWRRRWDGRLAIDERKRLSHRPGPLSNRVETSCGGGNDLSHTRNEPTVQSEDACEDQRKETSSSDAEIRGCLKIQCAQKK